MRDIIINFSEKYFKEIKYIALEELIFKFINYHSYIYLNRVPNILRLMAVGQLHREQESGHNRDLYCGEKISDKFYVIIDINNENNNICIREFNTAQEAVNFSNTYKDLL